MIGLGLGLHVCCRGPLRRIRAAATSSATVPAPVTDHAACEGPAATGCAERAALHRRRDAGGLWCSGEGKHRACLRSGERRQRLRAAALHGPTTAMSYTVIQRCSDEQRGFKRPAAPARRETDRRNGIGSRRSRGDREDRDYLRSEERERRRREVAAARRMPMDDGDLLEELRARAFETGAARNPALTLTCCSRLPRAPGRRRESGGVPRARAWGWGAAQSSGAAGRPLLAWCGRGRVRCACTVPGGPHTPQPATDLCGGGAVLPGSRPAFVARGWLRSYNF